MSITKKITLVVTAIVFFSAAVLGITNYFFSYKETLKSAGIELTGCASITTGIETPSYLLQVEQGNLNNLKKLENQVDWIVQHKKIFSEAYVLDPQGKLLVADKHARQLGFKRGDNFNLSTAALKQIKSGKTYYTKIYSLRGRKVITGYAPVYEKQQGSLMSGMHGMSGKGKVIATNAIDFDGGIVSSRTWEMNKFIILLSILLPIIAAIITIVFVQWLTRPIKKIGDHVEKVSKGDLSLKSLKVKSKDELGQLAHDFNKMVSQLQVLIRNVAQTSKQITSNSQGLLTGSKKAKLSTEQVAAQIDEANKSVEQQSFLTKQANNELGTMSGQVEEISSHINAAALKADKTNSLSQNGNAVVKSTIEQMNRIRQNSIEIKQIAVSLNGKSQEIDKVMTLINGISKQTNLLALNASIEAARAQGHGRGFAVVSEEIRQLADQTDVATREVADVIVEIQKESNQSVKKIIQGEKIVKDGLLLIEKTSDSFTMISTKSSETSQDLGELLQEILQIQNKMTSMVEEVAHITDFAENIAANTDKISRSGKQQNIMMQEFVSVAESLSKIASELTGLVNKFKYEK
ncbi:methyl-accepting chemotaxis protein [Liquorilactobacillus oeni]|nr:methyl-accepting chemotaxis protein [Liquorilactobacillus oeni]